MEKCFISYIRVVVVIFGRQVTVNELDFFYNGEKLSM
jgi:hypothetical protein